MRFPESATSDRVAQAFASGASRLAKDPVGSFVSCMRDRTHSWEV